MLARQDFSAFVGGVPKEGSATTTGDTRPLQPVGDTQQRPAPTGRPLSAAVTLAVLGVLWAGLHGNDPLSWVIGGPVLLGGVAVVYLLPAPGQWRLSPLGTLKFAGFALNGVLRGAVDVGFRALRPANAAPGHLTYRTRLPEGRPRRLFAIAITMLPGTLTARLDGDRLGVHALDRNAGVVDELRALEARIAGLYGIDLGGGADLSGGAR